MYNTLILNVDELWLKGKNRPMYFKSLKKHLSEFFKLHHEGHTVTVKNENQRYVAKCEVPFSEELMEAAQKIPGLNSVLPARDLQDVDKDAMIAAVLDELETRHEIKQGTTFKVQCKRVWKGFPHNSMDLNREVAGNVLKKYDQVIKVDVHNPEILIDVKIMASNIYISTRKLKCLGGLPVGTSGHAITMISGGFDSPVASVMMAKRGTRQTFIFFYAYPFVGEEVKDKIVEMCAQLGKFQKYSKLHVVPFGDIQNIISKNCHEEYRTLLFRKYMVDTANLLADRVHANAIVTGDALGQVSSQTMLNMAAVDKTSRRIILRPLVGQNKFEIINSARDFGTHDISIIPHDDACSLFAPKSPVITPDMDYWNKYVSENDLTEELNKALDNAEVFGISLKGDVKEQVMK